MVIYIVIFIFTILFTYLAEKNKNKFSVFIYSLLALLLPSVLAGLRDSGIGTDTQVYVDSSWNAIQFYANQPITTVVEDVFSGNLKLELVYNLIGYCVAFLGGDLNWFYFVLNFIVTLFVYLAIYDNRHKASMSLMMFVFLFSFYNITLNLVRQSLALSICLYAYKYIENKCWKKFAVFQIIALFTHNTAFFFLLLIPFNWLVENRNLFNKYLIYIVLIITPLCFSLSDIVIIYLVMIGFFPLHFLNYTSQYAESMVIRSALVIYILIWVILYWGARHLNKEHKYDSRKYLSFYFFSNELFFSSYFSEFAFRISYYFSYLSYIIFIPRLIRLVVNKNKQLGFVIKILTCALIAFYWYWSIVVHNGNETIPYKSQILDSFFL